MKHKLRATITLLQRTATVVIGILFLLTPATVHARGYANLSPEQLERLGIYFVYGDYTCGTHTSAAVTSSNTGSSSGGVWNSGVQPPYILESFMIEVLKDVAAKRGVSPSQTVTEEHAIALVAFAIGEGGDINNNDIFNPLNTGINVPDLASTAHNASGLQSFKSFDAGVEANARVMTGNNQRRLSDILIKPESSAEDFMKALTYFSNYPGNKLWAEASLPPHQDSYYRERLTLVNNVRADYAKYASLQIGLPEFEQKTGKRAPEKLQFHPAGSSTIPASTTATDNSTACTCSPASSSTGNNVIVIDPGHSGDSKTVTDPGTGLKDSDYPNQPEMDDVYAIAKMVESKLTADGYVVKLTKDSAGQTKTLRERAEVANSNHAALAISIHDQAGPGSDGLPFASANNIVYPQAVGLYREKSDGTQVKFTNADVANLSQTYARNFVTARQAAEGHSVELNNAAHNFAVTSINGRGLAPGNIWMVQLFSSVPWVYNEAGGNSAGQVGLNATDKQKYAQGLIDGVEKSIKVTKPGTGTGTGTGTGGTGTTTPGDASGSIGGNTQNGGQNGGGGATTPTTDTSGGCESASEGDIVKEAARLAWPSGSHGPAKRDATEAYQTTEPSPKGAGFTSDSGDDYPFSDCGVFVATVLISSGVDPGYKKRQTDAQLNYLRSSGKFEEVREPGNKDIASTKYLAPGDIMITTSGVGHTYIYSGKQATGDRVAYSASWHGHVPQATGFSQSPAGQGQHFAAFRLKAAAQTPNSGGTKALAQ